MTGFHANKILQRTVNTLITQAGVTSFVETGTYLAYTTAYVAIQHPTLPIFTCEIDDQCHATSCIALKSFSNVRLSKESSEKFIDRLVMEKVLGDMPMFFLDAHWNDYWPLLDEVVNIAKLPKFIILVDDFMVPGQSHFATSAGGGGTPGVNRTTIDMRPCDMTLIGSSLPQGCEVAYPTYSKEAIREAWHVVGYVLIMKGVSGIDALRAEPLHSWGGIR
jgi:hypothetical protein